MDTPLELLKKELITRKIISSGRGFSKSKRESKKLISEYEAAIDILETHHHKLLDEWNNGYNRACEDNGIKV